MVINGAVRTVNFENYAAAIIVDAIVNKRIGRYLLDSGVPVILSSEFAKTLDVNMLLKQGASDGQKKATTISFDNIDQLVLGNVVFSGIETVINSLSTSEDLKCHRPVGVIGASLMKVGAREIDFQKREISLTADISPLLNDKSEYRTVRFNKNYYHCSISDVELAVHAISDVIVDLGSNDSLGLSRDAVFLKQISNQYGLEKTSGYRSVGVFGGSLVDTIYKVRPPIKISKSEFDSSSVSFYNTNEKTPGTKIWSNTHLINDWSSEIIFTKKRSSKSKASSWFALIH